jgi:hypothetical protein
MNRLLVVVLPSLVLSASCAPRYDLFLSWTLDGQDASTACKAFNKPGIEVHAAQRDQNDGAVLDEHFDLPCQDGAGSIAAASFTDVKLELLSNESVWGASSSSEAKPGADDDYVGSTADNPLAFDIEVTKSKLRARLTAVGQSCGDADVSSFTVKLSENVSPLNEVVLVEEEVVGCEDGEAYFTYGPLDVGATYKIEATAVLNLATPGTGKAVVAAGPVTEVDVDLDRSAQE